MPFHVMCKLKKFFGFPYQLKDSFITNIAAILRSSFGVFVPLGEYHPLDPRQQILWAKNKFAEYNSGEDFGIWADNMGDKLNNKRQAIINEYIISRGIYLNESNFHKWMGVKAPRFAGNNIDEQDFALDKFLDNITDTMISLGSKGDPRISFTLLKCWVNAVMTKRRTDGWRHHTCIKCLFCKNNEDSIDHWILDQCPVLERFIDATGVDFHPTDFILQGNPLSAPQIRVLFAWILTHKCLMWKKVNDPVLEALAWFRSLQPPAKKILLVLAKSTNSRTSLTGLLRFIGMVLIA